MKFYFRKTLYVIFFLLLIIGVISFLSTYLNNRLTKKMHEMTWIHWVNSIERLDVLLPKFHGVEFDIVYLDSNNIFDVNHPPFKSKGLSLLEYLSSQQELTKKGFWFDFKNLSSENAESAVFRLDSLCEVFKLRKNQFIIESPNLKYLSFFNDAGFRTSYYIQEFICDLSGDDQVEAMLKITEDVSLYYTDYISTDKCNYELMREYFPNKKKLLWKFDYAEPYSFDPTGIQRKIKIFLLKQKIMNDETVEVVLFGYDHNKKYD